MFIPGSPPAGPPCPWAPWVYPVPCPVWPWCSRASGPARQLHSDTSAGPVHVSVPPADHLTSPNQLSRMYIDDSKIKSLGFNTIEQ